MAHRNDTKPIGGLLNISCRDPLPAPEQESHTRERECSKKSALSFTEGFVQQGPSRIERGASFNIPIGDKQSGPRWKGASLKHLPIHCAQICLLMMMLAGAPGQGLAHERRDSGVPEHPSFVTIPLSSLQVDQATARVSVYQEPQSPITTLFHLCRSGIAKTLEENVPLEDQGMEEHVTTLCRMLERFSGKFRETPRHTLNQKTYVIAIPLVSPEKGIQSALWFTDSLDEAITFVDVLQNGTLQAVKVFTTIPWSSFPDRPCSECPIKELVFPAKHMREQLEKLRGEGKE